MMKHFLAAVGLLLVASLPAGAQDTAPKVRAHLVAEDGAVPPGSDVTVALVEDIPEGWHTYWLNPGDAGAATEIKWALPHGWLVGAIQWPTPKRLPVGPLMDYGYEGKLWLLQKLTVPMDAKMGDTVALKAAVDWLVCKDVCVPENATLTLPLTIGPTATHSATAKDFATARDLVPVASPWKLTYALGKTLDIYAAAPALAAAHPVEADFFPEKPDIVDGAAQQTMGFTRDGLIVRLAPARSAASLGGILTGVLVLKSSDGSIQALNVRAPPGSLPDVLESSDIIGAPATGDITLWLAILSAFMGGLILNVMPCVLPILAMKALALARHSGREHNEATREGFAYSAGAILSFLVFGLVIVLLRQSGVALGWGFQLQEPVAVAGFALLIFAVGLNLSGMFEVGSITVGNSLAGRSGPFGAFFTGILAVAVAAPCTAPFMAAALGFALTQSVVAAMLVFLSLGLGFALPFLILGLWPRARSFLPKPGSWMVRLKQFLAFPMYGAVVWLAWVLAQETGVNGVVKLLAAMVVLALAVWLWGATRDLTGSGRAVGATTSLVILVATFCGLTTLSGTTVTQSADVTASSESFTEAKLASLRTAGTPVFVDATAAWCVTCLVNEQTVLSRTSIKDAFVRNHIAFLVADWTNRNAAITKLLDANERAGVPLYLYYAPGANKPAILPQILTEAEVLSAIGS